MAKFRWDKSDLENGVDSFQPKLRAAVNMYALTRAPQIESYMKANRPWTDRTGMAKTTLNVKVTNPNPDLTRLTLAHGVHYGIWLELANSKNYAIIQPTIDVHTPIVFRELRGLFNKIR